MQIGFFERGTREPTDQEINALMEQVYLFFKEMLQLAFPDSNADLTFMNVTSHYTEGSQTPVAVTFLVRATYGDGSPVPPLQVYEALKLKTDDLSRFLEDFVQNSASAGQGQINVFVNTNQISFEGHTVTSSATSSTSSGGKNSQATKVQQMF